MPKPRSVLEAPLQARKHLQTAHAPEHQNPTAPSVPACEASSSRGKAHAPMDRLGCVLTGHGSTQWV